MVRDLQASRRSCELLRAADNLSLEEYRHAVGARGGGVTASGPRLHRHLDRSLAGDFENRGRVRGDPARTDGGVERLRVRLDDMTETPHVGAADERNALVGGCWCSRRATGVQPVAAPELRIELQRTGGAFPLEGGSGTRSRRHSKGGGAERRDENAMLHRETTPFRCMDDPVRPYTAVTPIAISRA